MEVEFACQDDDICELRIEPERLGIGNAQLRGDVDLHPYFAAIHYDRHVGGDDCIHAGFPGCIEGLVCRFYIFLIQNNIERQICLHAVFTAYRHYFLEVLRLEIVR